jgi:hypothetical protein
MKFVKGSPKPPNSGRKKGTQNARQHPDGLAYLAGVMADKTASPDLRARAATTLAKYQCPTPTAPRTPALNPTPIEIEAPRTFEEVRALAARLTVEILAGRLDVDAGNAAVALLKGIEASIVNIDLKQVLDELKAKLPA